jgi:hypothetical protein
MGQPLLWKLKGSAAIGSVVGHRTGNTLSSRSKTSNTICDRNRIYSIVVVLKGHISQFMALCAQATPCFDLVARTHSLNTRCRDRGVTEQSQS